MFAARLVNGQRQVGKQFAEKEPRARLGIDEHGVLADPAKPCLFRDRPFQHRRAIDECPIGMTARLGFDPVRQALQAHAHHLVIVAPPGVTRHIGSIPFLHGLKRQFSHMVVIHAYADDAGRAGMQLVGMAALVVIARHVRHLAVMPPGEPGFEMGAVTFQVDVGDSDLLEAQFGAPFADATGQGRDVEVCAPLHCHASYRPRRISAARSRVASSLQKQNRMWRAPEGVR